MDRRTSCYLGLLVIPPLHQAMSNPNTLVPSPSSSGEDVSRPGQGVKQLVQQHDEKQQQQQKLKDVEADEQQQSTQPASHRSSTAHSRTENTADASQQEKGDANDGGHGHGDALPFKMPARSWLAFLTLCVLTVMVALDGTSISVALPVSKHFLNPFRYAGIL